MTCSRFPNLWELLKMHLQNKALRLSVFFFRFLVLCLISAVMIGSVPSASAAGYGNNVVGSFIDWSMDLGYTARNTLFSFFNNDVCPQSTESNGRHVYEKMKTTVNGKFGTYNICKYCGDSAGAVFEASSARGGGFSNKVKEDLGTTVLTSSNALLWSPGHDYTLVASVGTGKNGVYCSHHAAGTTSFQVDFNCVNNSPNFFASPAEGKTNFTSYGYTFGYSGSAPVAGTYRLLVGKASVLTYNTGYGEDKTVSYDYTAEDSGTSYTKGATVSYLHEPPRLISSGMSYITTFTKFYAQGCAPVYEVVPASELLPTIQNNYNIVSRSDSYQGDFGIMGDNGEITKIDNQYIVNETDNSVYNPVTNTTNTVQTWNYDYSSRTYNVTYDNGTTSTITYGDEYVTINEGDTIYNVYYLISEDSGSGSNTPGSGDSSGSGSGSGDSGAWKTLGELIGTVLGGIIEVLAGVLSAMLEALVSLAEMLRSGIVEVVNTILSIFAEVPALFSGFLDFLSLMFPFLPSEIVLLLTFGIAAVVFIGIIKAIRR